MVSRAADVSATVLLSEGLQLEGNPFVFALGGSWWSVALMTLVFIGMFVQIWWKLRTHEYHKTLENEGLLKRIMNPGNEETRVKLDLFTAIFLTSIGLVASFVWVVEHGMEKEWLGWKSSLAVGQLSGTLMFTIIVSVIISFSISRMKILTSCFLERPR